VFHVELRQFPHTARAFNLTREQLHARIVAPWLRGEVVEVDSQRFAPERAKLTIFEARELATVDMGMGRGWQNVMRRGEDVTEREVKAATVQPPATAAGGAGTAAGGAGTAAAESGRVTETIDHIDLVVSSLERSLVFYGGLLGPLGFTRWTTITGERGERIVYLGREGSHFAIGLRERQSEANDGGYDRYTIGVHHLAISAPSREVVDERAGWLAAQSATIESGPEEYDYSPTYYAVFFYDPDGIKLELVHQLDS
jgi:catechol 2,3-dioxygenase-like lactoylglutathione lyase family enzyme